MAACALCEEGADPGGGCCCCCCCCDGGGGAAAAAAECWPYAAAPGAFGSDVGNRLSGGR